MYFDLNRFKRILPLPSEGWADNMDSWFCHKHADDKSSNQLSLNPSPQDCFVADLYFVIHKSLIKHTCLTNNGQIQCRRCRQVVGQLYTLGDFIFKYEFVCVCRLTDEKHKLSGPRVETSCVFFCIKIS